MTEMTLAKLFEVIGPRSVALLALVFVTTVSGVLVAIKMHNFSWIKLGDFFSTMVLPKFGGWLMVELLAFFTSPEVLPIDLGLTHQAIVLMAYGAYATVFINLFSQFLANLHELGVVNKMTTFFSRKE